MLGASAPRTATPSRSAPGEIVLRLSSLSVRDALGITRVADVTLELRQCEILGIAALEDSGHQLLLRAIAGRAVPTTGTIDRRGEPALVPEDRGRDALISEFSVTENVALKGAGRARGRMDWPWRRAVAERLSREFDVRAPSVDAAAGVLSGGNQQKLVLARELSDGPSVIVAENPTRGLDIRATAAVHARLREAAAAGAAVVVYSSDLDEVLGLATRVVAVHQGRLREVLDGALAAGLLAVARRPPERPRACRSADGDHRDAWPALTVVRCSLRIAAIPTAGPAASIANAHRQPIAVATGGTS